MAGDLMRRLQQADPVRPDALALPDLAQLEAQWPAVGESPAEAPRRAPRKRWTGGFLSLSLAALVATGSAAATLTVVTGNPLGKVESVAVAPAAGTERIASVRAEDPDGGPPWAVKVGRAEPGLVCLNVGQVQGGQLGIRGLDGRFRTSAVGGADQCAVRPVNDELLANGRTFVGRTRAGSTSVVYGLVGPDVERVVVRYPDGASARLPLSPDGVFVIARRGSLTSTSPSLLTAVRQRRDANGVLSRSRLVDFGDPARFVSRHGRVERPFDPKEPVR